MPDSPAPRPSGTPTDPADAPSADIVARRFVPLGLHRLPPAAAELVLHGDLTGRYATGAYTRLHPGGRAVATREDRRGVSEHGHRVTAAIACHLARAGGTADQLLHLLAHPDHEGGRHLRTIALRSGHARALTYLNRVWASARTAVTTTIPIESRHHAHEDLAALRQRIETTPWPGERGRTALRVLRAHLSYAETAGGRHHTASERQTAEAAGISRQTLRHAYDTILKPGGWLRRLHAGHGREGSTWYLGNGPHHSPTPTSRPTTSQFPPNAALEEWPTSETAPTADIDSAVLARLMAHDAFAHHGLGSAALMLLAALHARPAQTPTELVATSSVSRATVYRTLHRLHTHGLTQHTDGLWSLAPGALDGIGNHPEEAATGPGQESAPDWDAIAQHYGTAGTAAQRTARHADERAAYRQALERLAEHRTATPVTVQDGRPVPVPAPRGDEVPPHLRTAGGDVLDPATGRVVPEWRIATDGRLILTSPGDQCPYDDLVVAHTRAVTDWESAA